MKHLRVRQHMWLLCGVLILGAGLGSVWAKEDRGDKMKQRLEQLFIWRVSDRLQLKPAEEERFTKEYKKLTEEKSQLSEKLDRAMATVEKSKNNKGENKSELDKALREYQTVLKKYNQLQLTEMEVMSKMFDSKKMAEYLLLKRDMTQKMKDAISQHHSHDGPRSNASSLGDPQVIQEK